MAANWWDSDPPATPAAPADAWWEADAPAAPAAAPAPAEPVASTGPIARNHPRLSDGEIERRRAGTDLKAAGIDIPRGTYPGTVYETFGVQPLEPPVATTVSPADAQAMTHSGPPPAPPMVLPRNEQEWRDFRGTMSNLDYLMQNSLASTVAGGLEFVGEHTVNHPLRDKARAYNAELAAHRADLLGDQQDASYLERVITQSAESAPPVLASMLGSFLAGPELGVAAIGPMTAGHTYGQNSAAGLDPATNFNSSLFQGGVEVATEFPGMKSLFTAGGPALRKFFDFVVRDMGGETAAQLAQGADDVLTREYRVKNVPITPEAVWQAVVKASSDLPEVWGSTALMSVAQGGPVVAGQYAQEKLDERSERKADEASRPMLDEIARQQAVDRLNPNNYTMAPLGEAVIDRGPTPAPVQSPQPGAAAPGEAPPAGPTAAPGPTGPTVSPQAPPAAPPAGAQRPTSTLTISIPPPAPEPPAADGRELVTEDPRFNIYRDGDGTFSYEKPDGSAGGFRSWDDAYDAANGKPVAAPAPAPAELPEDDESDPDHPVNLNARAEKITVPATNKKQARPALDISVAPSGDGKGFKYSWFAYTPETQFVAQWTEQTFPTREAAVADAKRTAAEQALSNLRIHYTVRPDAPPKRTQDIKDLEAIIAAGGLPVPTYEEVIAKWRGDSEPDPFAKAKAGKDPFGLSEAPIPAAPKVKRSTRHPQQQYDSILEYLSKLKAKGTQTRGLQLEQAIASLGYSAEELKKHFGHGINRAFTKGGMTMDQAAELLAEAGFRVQNEQGNYDPNVLIDLIRDELAGKKHYSDHNTTWMEDLAREKEETFVPTAIPPELQGSESEEFARLVEKAGQYASEDEIQAILESQADDATVKNRLRDLIERGINEPAATNEGQIGSDRVPQEPQGAAWETVQTPDGPRQQAVIPGAERTEKAPTDPLTLTPTEDGNPPPANVQPRLDLPGGSMSVPKAPERGSSQQPPPSLGGGLFASGVSTGSQPTASDIPTTLYRGSGRADKGSTYNGAAVPIAGEGLYYAFDRDEAKRYGPTVEERTTGELQNPLIIRSDEEWRALVKDAGWDIPNPFGRSREVLESMTQQLRKHITGKGHDGLIVWWDDRAIGDSDKQGRGIKTLRNVFDTPQAVFYGQPKTEAKPSPEPPPQYVRQESGWDFINTFPDPTDAAMRELDPGQYPETEEQIQSVHDELRWEWTDRYANLLGYKTDLESGLNGGAMTKKERVLTEKQAKDLQARYAKVRDEQRASENEYENIFGPQALEEFRARAIADLTDHNYDQPPSLDDAVPVWNQNPAPAEKKQKKPEPPTVDQDSDSYQLTEDEVEAELNEDSEGEFPAAEGKHFTLTAAREKFELHTTGKRKGKRKLQPGPKAKVQTVYKLYVNGAEKPTEIYGSYAEGMAAFNEADAETRDGTPEIPMDFDEDVETTPREAPVFPPPKKRTVLGHRAEQETLTLEQAQERVDAWKALAKRIGQEEDHSNEVILSLFDATGNWSQPYIDAGYTVQRFDWALGYDIMQENPLVWAKAIAAAGKRVVGVLSAPPCTSFSGAGARWWVEQHDNPSKEMVREKYGDFAAEYFDRPVEYGVMLVRMVEEFVAQTNPTLFYVAENPVGRIEEMAELPDPTLTIQPHHFGDPSTKRTMLYGEFNPNLPTANVTPKKSKAHVLRGDDPEQKAERSITPEEFAYAWFVANNTSSIKLDPQYFGPPVGGKSPAQEKPASVPAVTKPTAPAVPQTPADIQREGREIEAKRQALYERKREIEKEAHDKAVESVKDEKGKGFDWKRDVETVLYRAKLNELEHGKELADIERQLRELSADFGGAAAAYRKVTSPAVIEGIIRHGTKKNPQSVRNTPHKKVVMRDSKLHVANLRYRTNKYVQDKKRASLFYFFEVAPHLPKGLRDALVDEYRNTSWSEPIEAAEEIGAFVLEWQRINDPTVIEGQAVQPKRPALPVDQPNPEDDGEDWGQFDEAFGGNTPTRLLAPTSAANDQWDGLGGFLARVSGTFKGDIEEMTPADWGRAISLELQQSPGSPAKQAALKRLRDNLPELRLLLRKYAVEWYAQNEEQVDTVLRLLSKRLGVPYESLYDDGEGYNPVEAEAPKQTVSDDRIASKADAIRRLADAIVGHEEQKESLALSPDSATEQRLTSLAAAEVAAYEDAIAAKHGEAEAKRIIETARKQANAQLKRLGNERDPEGKVGRKQRKDKPITDASRPLSVSGGAPRKKFRKQRGVILPRRGPLAYTKAGDVRTSGRDQIWEQNGIDPAEARLWPIDQQYNRAARIVRDRFGFDSIERDANLQGIEAVDTLMDAYVSLNNLAVLLGLPDNLISFNGKMSLELKKGMGGAIGMHRLEGDRHTISVVRRNDTFAHEWGHALDWRLLLDNHIALMQDVENGRGQSGKTRLVGVGDKTDPLALAFVDLLNAMYFDADKADQYVKDLQLKIQNSKGSQRAKLEAQLDHFERGNAQVKTKNRDLGTAYWQTAKAQDGPGGDGGGKGYWQRPTEMLARAFEAYVAYKVELQGVSDTGFITMRDYLYRTRAIGDLHKMYPQTADRVAIFDAFDKLFDAMRHTGTLGVGSGNSRPMDTSKPRDWRATIPESDRSSWQLLQHDLRSQNEWAKRQREHSSRIAKDRWERRERKLRADTKQPNAVLSKWRNAYLATIERAERLLGGIVMTVRGDAFAMRRKYPESEAIQRLIRLLFTDPGSRQRTTAKFPELVGLEIRRFNNRLSKIAEGFGMSEWSDERKRALRDVLVGVRPAANAEEADNAAALRELLDDLYYYAQQNGLEIGYTKNGYLTRMVDELAVDERGTEFLEKARQVYEIVFDRDYGLSPDPERLLELARLARNFKLPFWKDIKKIAEAIQLAVVAGDTQAARDAYSNALTELQAYHDEIKAVWTDKAANDWYNRIQGIAEGKMYDPDKRGPTGSFMKSRMLPPEADRILGDFYVTDPEMLISTYINQNVRRALYAKFFGAPSSTRPIGWKIDDIFNDMIRDGVEQDDIDQLKLGVDLMTGTYATTMSAKGRRWRSHLMAFYTPWILFNSLWSQLAEPTTMGVRSGRMRDVFNAHGLMARDLLAWMKWLPKGQRQRAAWMEDFAETLGVVTDAYADELMQSRFNLLYQTPGDSRKISRFFRTIGVHQHSMAMRRAAAHIGMRYIMREMKAAADSPQNSKRWRRAYQNLAELGLRPQDDELQAMIRWLDTRPSMAEIERHPRFKDLQLAIGRFANESVMNPGVEDKPANASRPEWSHAYGILSFTLAFQRHVLIRTAKLAKAAVTQADAAQLAGVILPFATLIALQLAAYSAKFALLGGAEDDLEKELTKEGPGGMPNWVWIAATRSGLFGVMDPLFNAVYGIKYERDLANIALGPIFSVPFAAAQKFVNLEMRNSENTETAEFRATEALYDSIVGPAAVAAILRYSPAVWPWAIVGAGIGAAVRSKNAKTWVAEQFYENPKDAQSSSMRLDMSMNRSMELEIEE